MSTLSLIKKLWPFVQKYRQSLVGAFALTVLGALLAQVTPLVMEYTVNTVQNILNQQNQTTEQITWIVGGLVLVLFAK